MQNLTMAVNGSGKNVPFGAELGRGGEGSVFEISSAPKYVAKVYHHGLQTKKQEKILTMVRLKQEQLLRFSTWPLDVLKNPNNEIIGFIMPKITGKEIHELYIPKTRILEFPHATYPFLVHTAANLARAFAAIHDNRHVIGDVNHGNFRVTDHGIVKLLDCDSFQIQTTQETFRCEVGVPMYQPPELQNVIAFRDVERTPNHDNFGLAVFIFLLLFMGRHPFAGVYSGPEDMPIPKAIEQFRFAYSYHAAQKQMKPPPHSPSLNSTPPTVVQLFERAFAPEGVQPGNRPSALEWVKALEDLSSNLRKCTLKEQHHFSNHLSSCPWCTFEKNSGITLFLSQVSAPITGSSGQKNTFDLTLIWTRIAAVSPPPLSFPLPDFTSIGAMPSQGALEIAKKKRRKTRLVPGFVLLAGVSLLALIPQMWLWIILVSIILILSVFQPEKHDAFKNRFDKAKKERDRLISTWAAETEAVAFYGLYKSLESAKQDYQGLETLRNSRLMELQSKQRENQFSHYMQSMRIDKARIEGIGPTRTMQLQSFGIATAADISERGIRLVPGFGPSYTRRLLEWRDDVARRFVYNPKQVVSPSDVAALDRDISIRKQKLEQQLLSGAAQLQQLSDQIISKRTQMQKDAIRVAKEFAQAEADLNVL